MFGNSERRTEQWFKMVDPPGEARPDLWQIIAVAHRLLELGHAGMRTRDGRFLFAAERQGKEAPTWNYERSYDVNVDELLFEEYRKFSSGHVATRSLARLPRASDRTPLMTAPPRRAGCQSA